jgi:hypothetical protein
MMPMFRSVREAPLFALSLWRIVMSLSRAGADIDMADGLRSVAPIAERFGIFSAAEVDVDTLADRLAAEATETRACLIPPPLMAAWARRI